MTFSDVPTDYWAADQILACVDGGIVSGYPDGTYQPAREVTANFLGPSAFVHLGGAPIPADVVDEQSPWRHNPAKLARALMAWFEQHETQ